MIGACVLWDSCWRKGGWKLLFSFDFQMFAIICARLCIRCRGRTSLLNFIGISWPNDSRIRGLREWCCKLTEQLVMHPYLYFQLFKRRSPDGPNDRLSIKSSPTEGNRGLHDSTIYIAVYRLDEQSIWIHEIPLEEDQWGMVVNEATEERNLHCDGLEIEHNHFVLAWLIALLDCVKNQNWILGFYDSTHTQKFGVSSEVLLSQQMTHITTKAQRSLMGHSAHPANLLCIVFSCVQTPTKQVLRCYLCIIRQPSSVNAAVHMIFSSETQYCLYRCITN